MRKTGPTNYLLRKTIRILKKYSKQHKTRIWRYIAELLEKSSRKRIVVNISKINRYVNDGDIVIVPGKVLGSGRLEHKITIAAAMFSQQAVVKIKASGSRIMHILEFLNENPKGSKVKIIK